MTISQRLDLKQGLGLVMTPQLQQAIKLLQMSNVELSEFLASELADNPLLEREGADGSAAEEPARSDAAPPENESGPDDGGAEAHENLFSNDSAGDAMTADSGPTLSGPDPYASGDGGARAGDFLNNLPGGKPHLREHLLAQIAVDFAHPAERMMAARLLDMLDEAGWFTGDLATLAPALGVELPALEKVLARLQELDPPGVFARNLQECLALQLRERDRLDPLMQALLEHLPLLAARDMKALRAATGASDEDLQDMIAEIRALNPKPGLAFDTAPLQLSPPDLILRTLQSGAYALELNPETLPRVLVNEVYYTRIQKDARSDADKKYLSEKFQNAHWLVKALHQRATTIMKVGEEIVRQQDAFLAHGIAHMKPLTLRQVAEAVALHESTVSRVTSNKTLLTPRGLFPLKYFFSTALGDGDEAASSLAVKEKIKGFIGQESDDVLSDDTLAALLQSQGISIARRTVAKYREALGIPSSAERRRARRGE